MPRFLTSVHFFWYRSSSSLAPTHRQESSNLTGDGMKSEPNSQEMNGHAEEAPTPADVATCDKKYWSCPGANNLKASI